MNVDTYLTGNPTRRWRVARLVSGCLARGDYEVIRRLLSYYHSGQKIERANWNYRYILNDEFAALVEAGVSPEDALKKLGMI